MSEAVNGHAGAPVGRIPVEIKLGKESEFVGDVPVSPGDTSEAILRHLAILLRGVADEIDETLDKALAMGVAVGGKCGGHRK